MERVCLVFFRPLGSSVPGVPVFDVFLYVSSLISLIRSQEKSLDLMFEYAKA